MSIYNYNRIPADIKDAAFCTGIKYGTEEGNWDKILELYKTTKSYSEKESALNALACTNDENILMKWDNDFFKVFFSFY